MTTAQGLGLLLIVAMISILGNGVRDDSDPPSGYSNLAVYVDRKTGCEYVAAGGTSIIPRMRADGTQVCTAPTESQP